MIILLTIFVVIIIFLYDHFTKYNMYWIDRNIPGPKPCFFFGNIKDLALRRKEASAIYKDIYDKYPNEKLVGMFRMRTPTLLVKDLDIIQHILIKDFNVFMERDPKFSENGLGSNLFHSSKDTWQVLRSRLTPIFTPGKLKHMVCLLTENADMFVEFVDKLIEKQPEQEMHGIIKKYTIDSIATCVFGLDVNSFQAHRESLYKLEHKTFVFNHRAELDMMYPGILKRLDVSLLHKDVITFFTDLAKQIIDLRNGEPTGRNDIMDLLLALRKIRQITKPIMKENGIEDTLELAFTDEVLASQLFGFYTGGFQTTATILSFMMCHLAYDPDIQEKMVQEIKTVLENHEGNVTYEALSDLKYIEQVLCETLRMHAPVFSIRRTAVADYKVPGTDLTVKKGQIFIIPVPLIHMDPKIYPNPEVFDPERFTDNNARTRHSCAFLGFGIGPRSCMGYRFAKLQVKICLVKILSKFRVEVSKNTPSAEQFLGEPGRMIAFPIGGFPLKLINRC